MLSPQTSYRYSEVPDRSYKLLLVSTHAVQYASPVFRMMAHHPRLQIEVAYCSLQGAEGGVDPEFGRTVKWDVPLLDGYPWKEVPNGSLRPGFGRFFGLLNTGLWRGVRQGRYDAVVLYTGYRYASFWIALAAAKLSGTKVIFGTDATTIQLRDGARWKLRLKPRILSHIYRLADGAYCASHTGKEYLKSLGLPDNKIGIVPLVVDNDWWLARACEANRAASRAQWGVAESALVVLCAAKLQPWKRPQDVLRAFNLAAIPGSHLVFAGDGPLSASLEKEAAQLGVRDRVHFLGFQNQSAMPGNYCAADLFVLASEYDACPAAVCEAMLCGVPVAISDEIRGRRELIDIGETGYIFKCGDVDALADIFRKSLADLPRLAVMGAAARRKMDTCSPRTNVEDFIHLLDTTFGVERLADRAAESHEAARKGAA
jgi:glycosyltransferase involved in cell wall biosynthesis